MKVIVTGGAGFIGSNFIFYMMKKHPDYDIICLDSLTYAGNLSTLKDVMDNPHFKFVKLDIRDRDGVYKLFEEEKPDVVVNFAAESHVDRSIENPEVFLETNIIGTSVLRMHVVSTASSVSTKFQLMKFMVIYHLIVQIFSSTKTHHFTLQAHTHQARLVQTY